MLEFQLIGLVFVAMVFGAMINGDPDARRR
jgi:hypothetical protein